LLSQLAEAHREVVAEIEEIYPAFRLKEKSTGSPYPVSAG
jgi:hypothetical protein